MTDISLPAVPEDGRLADLVAQIKARLALLTEMETLLAEHLNEIDKIAGDRFNERE
jgi:hypothetical protein